jgi:hypothetical protein
MHDIELELYNAIYAVKLNLPAMGVIRVHHSDIADVPERERQRELDEIKAQAAAEKKEKEAAQARADTAETRADTERREREAAEARAAAAQARAAASQAQANATFGVLITLQMGASLRVLENAIVVLLAERLPASLTATELTAFNGYHEQLIALQNQTIENINTAQATLNNGTLYSNEQIQQAILTVLERNYAIIFKLETAFKELAELVITPPAGERNLPPVEQPPRSPNQAALFQLAAPVVTAPAPDMGMGHGV